MTHQDELEIFIQDYVKDLKQGSASIFAGAGLSVPAGYVNWRELMAEIAQDLGLNIKEEPDLISLAQFHFNENQTRSKLNRKIIEEFNSETVETENHRILARLPITSIWTTNYDELIEKSFFGAQKVVDVKYSINQLLTTKPKRDIVIYKMHGDVNHPSEAIITKEDYERYFQTHEPFINALTGELTTKTFLFIGFSFNDPNLDYVLSRLNFRYNTQKRQHYSFVKKPVINDAQNPDQVTLDYNIRRQALVINDLKRYGIKSLLINDYKDVTDILTEIERRFKRRTVFLSGSADVYDPFDQNDAIGFIHNLSRILIENDFRIINGFGRGIGSFVINGALEAIYSNTSKYSENQLILKPFPQFETGEKKLETLWEEYRQRMIKQCGISIFVFGNKKVNNEINLADGVLREFAISKSNGTICLPIGLTNYTAKSIYESILHDPSDYYDCPELYLPALSQLSDPATTFSEALTIISILLKQF